MAHGDTQLTCRVARWGDLNTVCTVCWCSLTDFLLADRSTVRPSYNCSSVSRPCSPCVSSYRQLFHSRFVSLSIYTSLHPFPPPSFYKWLIHLHQGMGSLSPSHFAASAYVKQHGQERFYLQYKALNDNASEATKFRNLVLPKHVLETRNWRLY